MHNLLKSLPALPLLFASWLAHALEEGASAPTAEPVSMVYVVLFGLLFFGMIVGFFVYLWWRERRPNSPE